MAKVRSLRFQVSFLRHVRNKAETERIGLVDSSRTKYSTLYLARQDSPAGLTCYELLYQTVRKEGRRRSPPMPEGRGFRAAAIL